jgi:hypothetical protein
MILRFDSDNISVMVLRVTGIQLMNKLHLIIHALENGEPCLVAQKYIGKQTCRIVLFLLFASP